MVRDHTGSCNYDQTCCAPPTCVLCGDDRSDSVYRFIHGKLDVIICMRCHGPLKQLSLDEAEAKIRLGMAAMKISRMNEMAMALAKNVDKYSLRKVYEDLEPGDKSIALDYWSGMDFATKIVEKVLSA